MCLNSNFSFPGFFGFSVRLCIVIFCASLAVRAQQDLPKEIRGYKVYRAKISVRSDSDKIKSNDAAAVVKLGDPQPIAVSYFNLNFDVFAEISELRQSGKVDFITFRDFRVNGLPIEIEEYDEPFEFSKNQIIRPPQPFRINVGFGTAARAAWRGQFDSREFWQASGRIFVFGHFKKGFLKFKRVIPVDINLQIKNPARNLL